MVSSIQLGNISNVNGRSVLSGLSGSGIDTAGLVDSLVEARGLSIVSIEDKITLNDNKLTALNDLKTLVAGLKDASDLLRRAPGFNKASQNAFDYKTATLTTDTGVAASNYVGITVTPGTSQQTFTIDSITSIAKERKQTTGNFAISAASESVVTTGAGAGQFEAGTVTVKGVDIALADGDSLTLVAAKFNAVSDDTGIRAGIIKISDNAFRLQFTATTTGTDADFDLDDAGTTTDPGGVFDQITFADTQTATDAVFSIDGQEVTRQTNSIDDVLTGITFNINQPTPSPDDTDISVSIKPDTTVAKNAIIGFINAYNDLKVFAAEQTQIANDGQYAEESYLATNRTLRAALNSVSAELTTAVDGLDGLNKLGDLGITFTDLPESADSPFVRNVLTLDEATLDTALSANFSEARKVFEFGFSSDNPNLTSFTRTNALGVSEFTLNVDPGTSTYEATYTDSEGNPQTIDLDATIFSTEDGYTLRGQTGTVLEGLVLLYSSTAADSEINVTATQGIGDRLFNLSTQLLTPETGAIEVELSSLRSSNDRFTQDIERLNRQLDDYREQLLAKFSALEQTITSVNTLLLTLDAEAQARSDNS